MERNIKDIVNDIRSTQGMLRDLKMDLANAMDEQLPPEVFDAIRSGLVKFAVPVPEGYVRSVIGRVNRM